MNEQLTMTDTPASFSIYDHHVLYNMTDHEGVQRGTIGSKPDLSALWDKFRKSWAENQDYLSQYPGGITMAPEKQQDLITIEQNNL